MPKKHKKRKLTVREARKVLTNEEAQKLIDMDEVTQEAVICAEQTGIIFIDEIDKIASKNSVVLQLMFLVKAYREIFYQLLKGQQL